MQTLAPETKRLRLGIYTPDFSQPISLMRILGPLSAMAKEDPRLELVFPPKHAQGYCLDWTWLSQCDAIFYSHPATDVDISVLWLARTMGIPIWSEYVDDIFNVRPTNPHYHAVKNKREVLANVTKAIEWSDVTTAVSEICRNAFPLADRIVVIPEACLWPKVYSQRRKAVSWRGLSSHDEDTATVLPQLCAVAKDFPDWEWILMGAPTEEMVETLQEAAGDRVKVAPFFSTPFHAFQAWAGQSPYLHIVPLADNKFNASKSHLAYLEASAIGAGVICPDHLPEWDQPGVIKYNASALDFPGKRDFGTVLRQEMVGYEVGAMPDSNNIHPNVTEARKSIYPSRTLREMNQRRWAVLRKLAERVVRTTSTSSLTLSSEVGNNEPVAASA